MSQDPGLYYKKLKIDAGNDIVRISGKIRVIGWARFLCVLAVIMSWWLIPSAWVAAGVSLVAIGTFLVLVKRHSVLFGNKMEAYCREEYADKGLSVVGMEIDKLPGGDEFADPQHPFTYDLDVFGKRSLFSVLDFTSTVAGRKILAGWLRKPETVSDHVMERQEAIRELAGDPKLRLDFATAACCGGENHSGGGVVVSIFPPLVNINTLQRIYAGICPWIFAILAIFALFGIIPWIYVFLSFLLSLGIVSLTSRKIAVLHAWLDNRPFVSGNASACSRIIENTEFRSSVLRKMKDEMSVDGVSPSRALGKLSGIVHNLDQRYNIFGFAILNGLFAWDWRQALDAGQWFSSYGEKVDKWNDIIGGFDAMLSLSAFAFNVPEAVYPELSSDGVVMCAAGLRHPLIPDDKVVANDCPELSAGDFMVITGANMAGKSTYLRTVGITYLLAMIGAPVLAERMVFTPAILFTSLRSTDSLADNESYFFSELKRLRRIVNCAQSGDKMFILLDEILKGTNSDSKQAGSIKFVEKMMRHDVCGMIATHDICVCNLAGRYERNISLYCFDPVIAGDEISFSYRMRKGIASAVNADFLMRRMGIIDS